MKHKNQSYIKRSPLWRLLIQNKKFFINPQFQRQFIIYVMSITLISLAIFYISQQIFFHQFYHSGEQLGLPIDHPYFQLLKDQRSGLSKIFFVTSALISCFILFSALFFSHRIAGPLYRLEKYFKNAANHPDLLENSLSFRKDDFFQELPDSVNRFLSQQRLSMNRDRPIRSDDHSTQTGNSKAS